MSLTLGDRVSIYGYISPHDGGTCYYSTGSKGEITAVLLGKYTVKLDLNPFGPRESQVIEGVHPKQCRKLVKKERRRVWLSKAVLEGDAGYLIALETKPDAFDTVEFVEVKKGPYVSRP